MNLIQSLSTVYIGNKKIVIIDKNAKELFCDSLDQLCNEPDHQEWLKLEVLSVDASDDNRVVFYVW